jgi:hypothetical protein
MLKRSGKEDGASTFKQNSSSSNISPLGSCGSAGPLRFEELAVLAITRAIDFAIFDLNLLGPEQKLSA